MVKMSGADRAKYYREALEEQRHLLRTAIAGMAAGDLVQGLRVATSIRTLVHETPGRPPLLKRLRNNYLELEIFDRIPDGDPRAAPGTKTVAFCPVNAKIQRGVVSLMPDVRPEDHAMSILGKWWANACMDVPGVGPVTRRELILGLANKEGGTHVDADISEKYKNLLASKFFNTKAGDEPITPVRISRLVAGRAGVELLDCLDRSFPNP